MRPFFFLFLKVFIQYSYFRGSLMSSCDAFFEGFSTFFLGKFSLLIFTRRQLKMGFLFTQG